MSSAGPHFPWLKTTNQACKKYVSKSCDIKENKIICKKRKKIVSSKVKGSEFWNESKLAFILSELKHLWNDLPSVMPKEKEKSHKMLVIWPVAKKSCVKYHSCIIIYIEPDRIRIQT